MPPTPPTPPTAPTPPSARTPGTPDTAAHAARQAPPARLNHRAVLDARELFWQNVIREMLTGLSVMGAARAAGAPQAPQDAGVFDGRLALVTARGERVPIGEVSPLFACGIASDDAEKNLSLAVECTVFQVRTPAGEVYTLPLHEIRGFQAISEDLMRRVEQASEDHGEPDQPPFGFAAFTSLSRQRAPVPEDASNPGASNASRAPTPEPGHPT